jgi:hypothetical protein
LQLVKHLEPTELSCIDDSGSWIKHLDSTELKVPKRENFSLAFYALSEPIWACDVGTAEKIEIFYQLTADFDVLWFFAANCVCGKQTKNLKLGQN